MKASSESREKIFAPGEFFEFLERATKVDRRTPEDYMRRFHTEKWFARMIRKETYPEFYPCDDGFHVVFPPAPRTTRNLNEMKIAPHQSKDKGLIYVFYSVTGRGLRTICSVATVSREKGLAMQKKVNHHLNK